MVNREREAEGQGRQSVHEDLAAELLERRSTIDYGESISVTQNLNSTTHLHFTRVRWGLHTHISVDQEDNGRRTTLSFSVNPDLGVKSYGSFQLISSEKDLERRLTLRKIGEETILDYSLTEVKKSGFSSSILRE